MKTHEIVISVSYSDRDNKSCDRCGRIRPKTAFYKERRRYDGLSARCKECVKAMRLARLQQFNEEDR